MHTIYKILFLIAISFTARTVVSAQIVKDSVSRDNVNRDTIPSLTPNKDTVPSSVNVELENIFNAKNPKQYTLSHITVTGTTFDPNLIISISGLAIGDKIILPGGDAFANAITNLWKQNLVSNVEIYLTDLKGSDLSVEMLLTGRCFLTLNLKAFPKQSRTMLPKNLISKKEG